MQGNDDAFNTGNPFTTAIPAYHSIQYNGSISGSISKIGVVLPQRGRAEQPEREYLHRHHGGSESQHEHIQRRHVSGRRFSPSTHTEVSPRIDLQLGQKNTLTCATSLNASARAGISVHLHCPPRPTLPALLEHTIQLSDSQMINEHIVNETRFQYLRDLDSSHAGEHNADHFAFLAIFLERRSRRSTTPTTIPITLNCRT